MAFRYIGNWFPIAGLESDNWATLQGDMDAAGASYVWLTAENAVRFQWRAKAFEWTLNIVKPISDTPPPGSDEYVVEDVQGEFNARTGAVDMDDVLADVAATDGGLVTVLVDELRSIAGDVVLTPEIDPGDPGYQVATNIRVRVVIYVGQWVVADPATPATTGTYLASGSSVLMARNDGALDGKPFLLPFGAFVWLIADVETSPGPSVAADSIVGNYGTTVMGTDHFSTQCTMGDGAPSEWGFRLSLAEPASGLTVTLGIAATTRVEVPEE